MTTRERHPIDLDGLLGRPDPGVERVELELSRRSVEVLAVGPEEGEPVLLLHGFPDGPETLLPLACELADAGCRCYAPAMPGYGRHGGDEDHPGHLDHLADDLLEQLGALELRRAVLAGHDWGALTAFVASVRAPGRVRLCAMLAVPPRRVFMRNLLAHPGQLWRQRYALLFLLPGVAEWWVRRRDGAYLGRLWERWEPDPSARRFEPLARERLLAAGTLPAALRYYRAWCYGWLWDPSGFWRSWRRSTRTCEVPGLVLAGREDGCIAPPLFAGSCRAFEGPCRTRLFDGVGHFLHAARPRAVADEVLRSLDEIGS